MADLGRIARQYGDGDSADAGRLSVDWHTQRVGAFRWPALPYLRRKVCPAEHTRPLPPPARDGSRWIGTDGGGLVHFRNGAFQTLTRKDGLASDTVPSLAEDREGRIWAGTTAAAGRSGQLWFGGVNGYIGSVSNGTVQVYRVEP
ncbi:MAG: hypothetical protein EXS33_06755 [Pedosphaera sp.]|nr:hypothetical protein [Pedosphaera sp.]